MKISLIGANKAFGKTQAVVDFDLEVVSGELFVLLGPSGCGKTTVLRLIAGLESPDRGSIVGGDQVWSALSPQARDVAMVFQGYALYPHRSVRGNIEYPLRLRGLTVHECGRLVDEVASLLGIQSLLDRSPRTLSGGEAQRVAVARALVRRPACFLLDEPLSSLDAQMRLRARLEIKRIQRSLGVTTLYVTHDQDEAVALGDRIGIMKDGRLAQVGTAEQLVERPANVFVAAFLGRPPMNLLAGTISRKENGLPVVAIGLEKINQASVELPENNDLPDGPVVVGLRPHDIQITTNSLSSRAATGWQLKGRISLIEGLEPDYVTHLDTPAGPVIARVGHRMCGTDVDLFLPLKKAHVFKESTGERLDITA